MSEKLVRGKIFQEIFKPKFVSYERKSLSFDTYFFSMSIKTNLVFLVYVLLV